MALLFVTHSLTQLMKVKRLGRPKKLLKSKIQTSRAKTGLDTTTLNLFNVAQLAFADTNA